MSGLHQVSTITKNSNIEATAKEFKNLSVFTLLLQFQRHIGTEHLNQWVDLAQPFNKGGD